MEQHSKRKLFKTLHHISGIVLSIFIGFHLLNHLFSLAGPERHIQMTEIFRMVYRNPIVETLLLAVVVFQIITGFRLLFGRNAKHWVERVQVYSGMYLSFFLLLHVSAVLMGRYVEHLDTNFWYAAAGLNIKPATLFFIPYYFLSVTGISLHVASLHYLRTQSAITSWGIAIAGIISSVLILVGFTHSFQWHEIPVEYQAFIHGILG